MSFNIILRLLIALSDIFYLILLNFRIYDARLFLRKLFLDVLNVLLIFFSRPDLY